MLISTLHWKYSIFIHCLSIAHELIWCLVLELKHLLLWKLFFKFDCVIDKGNLNVSMFQLYGKVWQMAAFGSENWHAGSGKKVHEFHEYFVSLTLSFHYFYCVTQHCVSICQRFFWPTNFQLLLFTCQFTTNSLYILVCLAFRNSKWNQTIKQ